MRDRGRHFRVGLLLLLAASLFVTLIVFTIGSSLRHQVLTYYICFAENVKGMVVGSKVNFQGVPAGAVTDIRFVDGKSLVEIQVGADQGLVQDVTRARLDRLLVTGQVTIELEGYEPGRPRLDSGAAIQPAQNPMDELAKSLPDVVDSVPMVMREVHQLVVRLNGMLDDDNCMRIERILLNLERASARLPVALDSVAGPLERAALESIDVLKQADATLVAVRAGVGEVRGLVAGDAMQHLVEGLGATVARLAATQHGLEQMVNEARSLLASNRGPIGDALAGVRDAMRDVRGLARMLQLAPSSLLYGRATSDPAVPPESPR
ncbi:MAG: MlaD family protein [Planctomycetota bacterium]